MVDRVRVGIVDDLPLYRQGIRSALRETDSGLEVVAEASSGRQIIDVIQQQTPDVLIVDATLGDMSGLEVTRIVKQQNPSVAVVIMTAFEDEEELFKAIKVGAAAYITKDISSVELVTVVRKVQQGNYLINDSVLARPLLASRVLHTFRELASVGPETEPIFVPLSAREVEVLENIARGNSNKEIAKNLGISDQTVKNHITSILRKLAVNDRTEAVVYAIKHGWIKMEQV
jgi:DNA-binding NarL/FixJ family response regulator